MNNKLQQLQIDLMKDSKLKEEEFVEKYSERLRDLFLDVDDEVEEIKDLYYGNEMKMNEKINNWQRGKMLEGKLGNKIFKKITE